MCDTAASETGVLVSNIAQLILYGCGKFYTKTLWRVSYIISKHT